MPELKPCPACNNVESIIHMSFIAGKTIWFVECDDDNCVHHGEACFTEAAAIAAWNSPRALTWTTEPPKVAGWYLRRHNIAGRWSEADVMNFTRLSVKNSIIRSAMIQWAGPIPTPLEPGES